MICDDPASTADTLSEYEQKPIIYVLLYPDIRHNSIIVLSFSYTEKVKGQGKRE